LHSAAEGLDVTSRHFISILMLLLIATTPSLALAQEAQGTQNQEALAKAAQNPIANLISLPLQNNTDFGLGPEDGTRNVLNIQPVWPFHLGESWNLITRTIVPVVSQPGFAPEQEQKNGLGDTTFTAFFSPQNSGSWTWGVGPVFLLPTSTDDRLGVGEWGAGASAVFLTMPGSWVVGSLFSNVRTFGDDSDPKVNLFTWQYFINYNFGEGWYLTSAPIMTADWEADSNNRWAVPLGGGLGKVFRLGKLPVNANAQAYSFVEAPAGGPDWQLRLQVQFLFPK